MIAAEKIGFIGLGVMGAPMAGHLIAAGYSVRLHTRRNIPQELIDAGGTPCTSPSDAAKDCDYIITMVQDTPDVDEVLFGKNGASENMSRGAVVIDMSSITPSATRQYAAKVRELGGDYLDAPVSGGDIGARKATLTIMVGGNKSTFDRALPLLSTMGTTVTHIGDIGAGQVCKLANQIVGAQAIQAVGEALLFASKSGVDPAKVREALMGGFASSRVLEVHGLRMLQRDFEPGFRTDLHRKDMQNVIKAAADVDATLPNATSTATLMNAAVAMGFAADDSSALLRVLEAMNNARIGDESIS